MIRMNPLGIIIKDVEFGIISNTQNQIQTQPQSQSQPSTTTAPPATQEPPATTQ